MLLLILIGLFTSRVVLDALSVHFVCHKPLHLV